MSFGAAVAASDAGIHRDGHLFELFLDSVGCGHIVLPFCWESPLDCSEARSPGAPHVELDHLAMQLFGFVLWAPASLLIEYQENSLMQQIWCVTIKGDVVPGTRGWGGTP